MSRSRRAELAGAGPDVEPRERQSWARIAQVAAHLTARDRMLLRVIGDQRVLTTGQVSELAFGSVITARHRLAVLDRLGVIARFRPHAPVGSNPWHVVLAPLGAMVLAVEDGTDPEKARVRARRDRMLAVGSTSHLAHTVALSGFYIGLVNAAAASGGTAELVEWHSERNCRDWFRKLIEPDGYGVWRENSRHSATEVAFFVEFDNSTEKHATLVAKLGRYQQALHDAYYQADRQFTLGDREPWVLFVFTSARREVEARAAFTRSGKTHGLQIATTVAEPHGRATGRVWLPFDPLHRRSGGHTGAGSPRRTLGELNEGARHAA